MSAAVGQGGCRFGQRSPLGLVAGAAHLLEAGRADREPGKVEVERSAIRPLPRGGWCATERGQVNLGKPWVSLPRFAKIGTRWGSRTLEGGPGRARRTTPVAGIFTPQHFDFHLEPLSNAVCT